MPVGGTAFLGQNQHPRITTTYLNQLNRHGDPAPGVNVSTAQISGSIVQPYDGFQGGKLTITNPWAVQFADPAVGPLYGGVYQYVRLNPADTAPPVRGQVLFWMDELHYIVTTNAATPGGKIAGVSLNATTPGNWDFIQISGIANVMFSAAAPLGASVGITAGTTPAFAATAATLDKNFLGIAVLTAPVANQVSPVELNLAVGFNY
jgi:hypothetical protein